MQNKAILENGKLNPLCLMPGDVVKVGFEDDQWGQIVKDVIYDYAGTPVAKLVSARIGMSDECQLPHPYPQGYKLRNDEDTRKLLARMGFALYDEDEEMIFYERRVASDEYERRVASGKAPARSKGYATLYLEFDKDESKWYVHWKHLDQHFNERIFLRQVTYLHEIQHLYLAMSGEKLILPENPGN